MPAIAARACLLAAYGRVQSHCSRLLSAQAGRIERLESENLQLRARLIRQETLLSWEREDRAALERAVPGRRGRAAPARRVGQLMERVQALMRERLAWQDRLVAPVPPSVAPPRGAGRRVALREKSVLCVSEDAMALMLTRKVVEMAGGRYQGRSGKEDADTLEASLVAADLVICQTGWRQPRRLLAGARPLHAHRQGMRAGGQAEALDGLRPTETAGADGAVGAGSVRASRPRRPRARSSGTAPRAHSAITRKPPGA